MIKSKKGLSFWFIVLLILGIIFLAIMLVFQDSILSSSKYQSEVIACNTFLNGVNGNPIFFSNDFSNPTFTLINSISEICPYKNIEISKNNLNPLNSLINSCYQEGGEGVDFMGSNSEGESICIFCGFAKSQDNINDFNKILVESFKEEEYKNLFEEKETLNLNKFLYNDSNNLPDKVEDGDHLAIIYFSYKPVYKSDIKDSSVLENLDENYESAKREVSKFFGDLTNGLTKVLSDSNSQTITGVYLTSWDYEKDVSNLIVDNSPTLDSNNFDLNIKCGNFIIPKNKHD